MEAYKYKTGDGETRTALRCSPYERQSYRALMRERGLKAIIIDLDHRSIEVYLREGERLPDYSEARIHSTPPESTAPEVTPAKKWAKGRDLFGSKNG